MKNLFNKRESNINTSTPESKKIKEDIWRSHLLRSDADYLMSQEKESPKETKEEGRVSRYLFNLNRSIKRIFNNNDLKKNNIEDDPKFFEFLINQARDFKIALFDSELYKNNPDFSGLCYQISLPFAYWLNYRIRNNFSKSNIEAVVISGSFKPDSFNHHWVQIGTTILDLSVGQFKDYWRVSEDVKKEIKNNTINGTFISNDENNVLYKNYSFEKAIYTDTSGSEVDMLSL